MTDTIVQEYLKNKENALYSEIMNENLDDDPDYLNNLAYDLKPIS